MQHSRVAGKKAQVAIFLIILLILVVSIGFHFLTADIREKGLKAALANTQDIGQASQEVQAFVHSCMTLSAEPLVAAIANHGGKFMPGSNVYHDGTELTVFCTEEPNSGCRNDMILRQDMESELSEQISRSIRSCLDFSPFTNKGIMIQESPYQLETIIELDTVRITMHYPLVIKYKDAHISLQSFSQTIYFPLGRLYGLAIDITNEEISKGAFDSNEWLLSHGFEIAVKKMRPYPDTIYVLTKADEKKNENYTFAFAIKGFESAGTSYARLPAQSNGCCINTDNTCLKNAAKFLCPGQYIEGNECRCHKNFKTIHSGCCKTSSSCFASTAETCQNEQGVFSPGDPACNSCAANCEKVWVGADKSFSGPIRRHGEGWCSYDAIIGYGFDYVGSRHYVHSCINGQEFVEECRDFREEICVEDGNKAHCRINRWQDCTSQQDEVSCLNRQQRDCHWMGSSILLNRKTRCVPSVPAGFKFWEGNGEQICNFASENPSHYQINQRPSTWGHSTALFCQRQGDCGNYRNLLGEITKVGYFNHLGNPEDWIYGDSGNEKKGHQFVLDLPFVAQEISAQDVAQGSQGNFATCDLWQAPNRKDKCKLCNEPFKICSEYRCKSLGRSCEFSIADSKPLCLPSKSTDITPPEILFDETILTPGHSSKLSYNLYYRAKLHEIQPAINPYEPITFGFITSEPARCEVSMRLPNVPKQLWYSNVFLSSLPQAWMSSLYQTRHSMTLRFPDKSLGNMTEYFLFISCQDEYGNVNEDANYLSIKVMDPLRPVAPKVLEVLPEPSTLEDTAPYVQLHLYINKPFRNCRYSTENVVYELMQHSFDCNTTVHDISFVPGFPLGSFSCDAKLIADRPNYFLACMDWDGKTSSENFELIIPKE